jgi:hypothetical protein
MKYEHRGLDPETEGRKRSPRVENGAWWLTFGNINYVTFATHVIELQCSTAPVQWKADNSSPSSTRLMHHRTPQRTTPTVITTVEKK